MKKINNELKEFVKRAKKTSIEEAFILGMIENRMSENENKLIKALEKEVRSVNDYQTKMGVIDDRSEIMKEVEATLDIVDSYERSKLCQ